MADFNRIRPGYELIKVNFEWGVKLCLHTIKGRVQTYHSPLFKSPQIPGSEWQLQLEDMRNDNDEMPISLWHFNSVNQFDPFLIKLSILNVEGQKVLQQMEEMGPKDEKVDFINLSKEEILKYYCQQGHKKVIFNLKILSHVKKEPEPPCSPPAVAINCLSELSTQLQELFDGMQLSDVKFNVRGREFPAHKNILAARSKVFEAMFKHPTKENSTNQIEIEDIKPEVFNQLLRFIYTGKVPLEKLTTMAAGLFIAADKYLLDGLKKESENYLLRHMSADNCIELLLNFNLLNSAEELKKESARFFRLHQDDVVATGHWEMVKKDNPALLCDIQECRSSCSAKVRRNSRRQSFKNGIIFHT